jgi:hypothetical protein
MAVKTYTRGRGAARGDVGPAERQRMISEAAYYRFVRRGYAHGHDLEDWLAAEAELFAGTPVAPTYEAADLADFEFQQHSRHSKWEDDAMKRAIRKHPQRDIPQIEGIEPQEAPFRE